MENQLNLQLIWGDTSLTGCWHEAAGCSRDVVRAVHLAGGWSGTITSHQYPHPSQCPGSLGGGHYLHTIYTLSTHYLHTIYTLSTYYLHTIYTLSTHYLHYIYALSTHYLHTSVCCVSLVVVLTGWGQVQHWAAVSPHWTGLDCLVQTEEWPVVYLVCSL